jgi:hypothetical protein
MQQRRARSVVETALARGRIAEAADALLVLPREGRTWALEQVSHGMSAELLRNPSASDHGLAFAWLLRLEREPRFLPAGDDGPRVRWVLLLAAVRAKQWARAQALLAELEPELAAAPLRARLAALIEARGEPTAKHFGDFDTDGDAARLGYDEVRMRVDYAPPASPDDVERACLECFGCESWARFGEVVTGWLAQKPRPELARALGLCAGLLSHRELARRAENPRSALEVARFCALCSAAAGAPMELEPTLTLCLRVVARALQGEIRERAVVDAAQSVCSSAQSLPRLAPLLEPIALGPVYAGQQAIDAAERWFRSLLAQRPSLELALGVTQLLLDREDLRTDGSLLKQAPEWLITAFEALLAEPVALRAALSDVAAGGAATPAAQRAVELFALLPVTVVARALDLSWSASSDEPLRELLATAAEDLVARMRSASAPSKQTRTPLPILRAMAAELGMFELSDATDAELRHFLSTPRGRLLECELSDAPDEAVPLSPVMRAMWQPLSARMLSYRPTLFAAAVELTSSTQERSAIVDQFWARRPTLLARLAAVRQATEETAEETVELLLEHLTRNLTLEQLDVARSVLWAERGGAPRPLRRRLCKLLHEAIARDGRPHDASEVTDAMRLADALVGSERAKKAKPKKQARASKKGPRAKSDKHDSRAASGEPEQQTLAPHSEHLPEQLALRLGVESLSDG